ncbi:MAG: GntR family transcriptional regulator [Micropruina sp.]|uniref:GntR family transcriptional regulator n=1 Tax=Micropruina sp. TaxID=2737536 RepID=UPI0039E47542
MTPRTGREAAYQHLRNALLTDPSMVGTFIDEATLAKRIGVSRTPVREALLLLSAQGLVQLIPNRGAFVPALSAEEVHHIMQARSVIEVWAAREAMRNLAVPLDRMHAILERQRTLPGDCPAADFIAVDREFHTELVAAGRNPVITQMYEAVRVRHVVIGVAALAQDPDDRRQVLAEHEAIVDALASGDEAAVEHALRAHLMRTVTRHARG